MVVVVGLSVLCVVLVVLLYMVSRAFDTLDRENWRLRDQNANFHEGLERRADVIQSQSVDIHKLKQKIAALSEENATLRGQLLQVREVVNASSPGTGSSVVEQSANTVHGVAT